MVSIASLKTLSFLFCVFVCLSSSCVLYAQYSLECFNLATYNYGLWQPFPVRYRTRKKTFFVCLSSRTRKENKKQQVHIPRLPQESLKFDFLNNTGSYIFACYFIHPDKLCIFTSVFMTVPVQHSPTLDVLSCMLMTKLADCVGPFQVDQFYLYCRCPRQKKLTF